jgi:hypothetical protein
LSFVTANGKEGLTSGAALVAKELKRA